MRTATIAFLALVALVYAQSNAVSVNGLSSVPISTETDASVNGLSFVPRPTASADVSVQGSASLVPNPESTSAVTSGASSNKGKIAGGVVGGLAVVVAAVGACIFVRLRRRSTRHWRNRNTGTWNDQQGKSAGSVYVGKPLDRPFDGYNHDVKASASPTTPTASPLFIREPRVPHSFQSGHTRGFPSTHYHNESIEMQTSPTQTATRF